MTEWIRRPWPLEGGLLAAFAGLYFLSTYFIFAISKWDEGLQRTLKLDELGWRIPFFFTLYFMGILLLALAAAYQWPVTWRQMVPRFGAMLFGHLLAWGIGRYGYAFFLFPAVWLTLLLSLVLGGWVGRSRL